MKDKCVACGFTKDKWRDYECPRCRCPQSFHVKGTLSFLKLWRLRRMYKNNILKRTDTIQTYRCFRNDMDEVFEIK